jgi:hypothetical protein
MIAASQSAWSFVIPLVLMVLFGAGMIFDSIRQSRIRQQRVVDLRSVAARLGFDNFNPNRDEGFVMGWGFLDWLSRGQDRYAFNVLRGTYHEQALFVFDYHYQTGSGKSREEHNCTLLMLIIKEAFPQLTIGPGNLGEKIATAFGIGSDIKFESAEFSRMFSVRSPDKKFAYDVCNPQMIEYLLANRNLQVEIQGPVILLTFEPQLPVGQIEFNLQRLIEIRSRLPEYLFTNVA